MHQLSRLTCKSRSFFMAEQLDNESRFATRGTQQHLATVIDDPVFVGPQSSDHIVEAIGYSSNTTTNGFGQVNGFEFLFRGGG